MIFGFWFPFSHSPFYTLVLKQFRFSSNVLICFFRFVCLVSWFPSPTIGVILCFPFSPVSAQSSRSCRLPWVIASSGFSLTSGPLVCMFPFISIKFLGNGDLCGNYGGDSNTIKC